MASVVLLFGAGGTILFAQPGRLSSTGFLYVLFEGQTDDVSEPLLFPAGHFCQCFDNPLLDTDSFVSLDSFALLDSDSVTLLALLGHGRA